MGNEAVCTITLKGDLSMVGVREQCAVLSQHLQRLAEAAASGYQQFATCEVDLTGLQALDACGCQLLVTFFRTIAKHGAGMFSLRLNDDFREKIHALGFDDELFARNCA